MSGYTALMQQNEQLAKVKHRRLKEVLEASVSVHQGKILQYYGDGALSIFVNTRDSHVLLLIAAPATFGFLIN